MREIAKDAQMQPVQQVNMGAENMQVIIEDITHQIKVEGRNQDEKSE